MGENLGMSLKTQKTCLSFTAVQRNVCSFFFTQDVYLMRSRHLVPEINRIIQKETYDIVRPQWILDCIQQNQLVPLSKKCPSCFIAGYIQC